MHRFHARHGWRAPTYYRVMQAASSQPHDERPSVKLPAQLQAELEDALVDADRAEGISADELFARIKQRDEAWHSLHVSSGAQQCAKS